MDIAILDYVSGEVNLYTIPDGDDVKDFMSREYNYPLDYCTWMCNDNIKINDERENY